MIDLTNEDAEIAKHLAIKIGEILGNAERPIIVSAVALSLAVAELIDFADPIARTSLRAIMDDTITKAITLMAEYKEGDDDISTGTKH